MKTKILLLKMFLISIIGSSQNTYVPDDNFEQALIDLGYDDVLDDYVATVSIDTVTFLAVRYIEINDLTGIEGFVSLDALRCEGNNLTSLDLSNNTALTYVDCSDNNLTTINISTNTALVEISCFRNNLSTLDVSNNLYLEELNFSSNNLTTIDLSNNLYLWDLRARNNNLNTLDLSNNTNLRYLRCENNNLNTLDVSNCDLIILECEFNNLTSLNTNDNYYLFRINCDNNNLNNLDICTNYALEVLTCDNNSFTHLNLTSKQGRLDWLSAHNNPLLCIDVDDVDAAISAWGFGIDDPTIFSEDCGTIYSEDCVIPLNVDEFGTSAFKVYPNPVNDIVAINLNEGAVYSLLNLNGQILAKGELLAGENELDLSHLNNGLYFLKIITGEGISTKKLIKQ